MASMVEDNRVVIPAEAILRYYGSVRRTGHRNSFSPGLCRNQSVRLPTNHRNQLGRIIWMGMHRIGVMKLTKPDLTFLRQLMGNPWINGNVFGENPKHLLGRWQQKEQFNPWVLYIEELSRTILTSANIKLDTRALAKKLDADYGSTLAEMECAVFLAQQGFSVTLEPTAPEKGPDIRADWDETPYFVEVRALGDCEEDDRFKSITRQLFSRLNTVRSSYSVAITVGDEYFPGTSALKSAIDAVLESLNIAKEHKWKSATLYHSPSGTLLNPGGDFSGTRAGHREIVNKADFIARFTNLGEER